MSRFLILVFALLASHSTGASEPPTRVLFVGNSLTYVNNVPAMVSALATANGKRLEASMLVKGGHTIARHLDAGVVVRALAEKQVDILVLQEQGGAFLCFTGLDCDAPRLAHAELAKQARANGARVVMLGTYQFGHEGASRALEAAEAEVAAQAGIPGRIAISESGRAAMQSSPGLSWLDADGSHPGEDLSMLMAIRLYHAIYRTWPAARRVQVRGTDYSPSAKFSDRLIQLEPARPSPVRSFDAVRMRALSRIARGD